MSPWQDHTIADLSSPLFLLILSLTPVSGLWYSRSLKYLCLKHSELLSPPSVPVSADSKSSPLFQLEAFFCLCKTGLDTFPLLPPTPGTLPRVHQPLVAEFLLCVYPAIAGTSLTSIMLPALPLAPAPPASLTHCCLEICSHCPK